jgi:GntR family transcriptional repressor for pyruvate dehydrogenase complex
MADEAAANHGPGASEILRVNRVRPAYQQVADQLRDRILDGSVAAGDRLPTEVELSEIFGVSRSTVREALRVLASRGLIRTTRGTTGGTFVARVEFDQVSDYLETSLGLMSGAEDISMDNLLEARESLEVPAAGLAALRHRPEHVVQLREAVEREKVTRTRGTKFREHREFHGIVLDASGNPLIGVVTAPVFRVLRARAGGDMPGEYWRQIDSEHIAIIERIEAGDHDGAVRTMRGHLATVRRGYELRAEA